MLFEDFVDILDLLSNPDKYKAKVKELIVYETAIKENIALGITAANVAEVQRKTDAMFKKAATAVEQAKTTADSIVAGATVVFNKRNTEVQEREVLAETAIAENKQMKADRQVAEQAFRVLEKQLNQKAKALQEQEDALRIAQAEVETRLAKLRTVMG